MLFQVVGNLRFREALVRPLVSGVKNRSRIPQKRREQSALPACPPRSEAQFVG